MMNTNRYFSFSRFGQLLKHDLVELWKSYFRALCIMFLTSLIIYYMAMGTYNFLRFKEIADVERYVDFHFTVFAYLYVFYMLIKASQFMEPLYTKEARIRYLMLPATSLEKFISFVLGVTVVPTVIFVVAVLLADVVHFAIYPFFPNLSEGFKIWVVPELWEKLLTILVPGESVGLPANIELAHVSLVLYIFLVASCIHSIFILAGNLFGKSGITAIVLILVLTSQFGIPLYHHFRVLVDWCLTVIHENGEGLAIYMINVVCLCLNVFIWWLNYKIFSRKQVVQPKFSL